MTARFVTVAGAIGAAMLIVMAAAYAITREASPIIHVRWRADVEAAERQDRRQAHALSECSALDDRTDRCELLDTSRSNLAAIVGDSTIEDTYHLQRSTLTIAPDADLAPRMTWIAYRVPLLRRSGVMQTMVAAGFVLLLGAAVAHVGVSLNLVLAGVAVVLFGAVTWTTGRIEVNDGMGYDGRQYAAMLQKGLGAGTPMSRMRPVVVLLARIPFYATQDVVRSFELLNYVFAFLLAYLVGALGDRYGIGKVAKAYLVVSLALCIATAKMFAYYPVLIDLGSYVAIAAAVYAILVAPRPVAAFAVCVAVLTREFAIAAALFGLHRDIRQRAGVVRSMLTYAPALLLPFVLRRFAVSGFAAAGIADIVRENAGRLNDPLFLGFFGYFLLTTFGGVSLILFARIDQWFKVLAKEHEWITFGVVVFAMALLWSFDFWRYIAFLLPLVVVLFATASAAWTAREQVWLYAIAAFATWYTQRPFEHVDLPVYFRDWFPYYVASLGSTPLKRDALWPLWTWRYRAALAFVLILAVSHLWRRRAAGPAREVAPLASI